MAPIKYGWIAGGILFLVALATNPWLCIPYALLGPGYAFLIVAADDQPRAKIGHPAFRWWFCRINPADITALQIGVICSIGCFFVGVVTNSWLSIPYAIGGLLVGLILGGVYSGLRWIVRKF